MRLFARRLGIAAQIGGLAGWLLLTFAFAAVGAMASIQAQDFYLALQRPAWAPPAWLFGPVWTVLYLAMAVAAWLVWRAHGFVRGGGALVLFVVQLGANALWTWLYFVWQQGAWALAELIVLWLLIAATVVAFARLNRWAAVLLLPYLGWVAFAGALTWATWRMNPAVLG